MFVGKINPKKAHSAFSGYADKKASEKKVIHDVFVKGDSAFNSGTRFSLKKHPKKHFFFVISISVK